MAAPIGSTPWDGPPERARRSTLIPKPTPKMMNRFFTPAPILGEVQAFLIAQSFFQTPGLFFKRPGVFNR
jgi:hypothetical protein